MRFWLVIIFSFSSSLFAQQQSASRNEAQLSTAFNCMSIEKSSSNVVTKPFRIRKKGRIKRRWVGAVLCLFLGVFGVHRLYFGTNEKVPIFYTLTLGGFLILPLIDLFLILFKKNKEDLEDDKMIFW